jgi:oligopeptide transport system substrate-binding protein
VIPRGQGGRSALTAAAAFALLVAATIATAATPGGTLRRAGVDDPATLDPARFSYPGEVNVVADLFTGLLTLDAAARPVPGCAESWTISEDGLVWTFRLRPRLQWSDGRPLTATDFEYSFRRMLDPRTAFTFAARLYSLKNARLVNAGKLPPSALGVAAPDARTVVLRLEHPAPYLPEVLASYSSPSPRHAIEAAGRDWTRPGRMVSNGPFTLAEWVPNSHVKLVRNPLFYDAGWVSLAAVHHVTVDSAATAVRRFRAGELDVVLVVPPEQIDWARVNLPKELHVGPGFGLEHVAFNVRRPPFDDVRVRRALALAIDREALTAKVLRAGEVPAYGIVPPRASHYPTPARADFATWAPSQRTAEARRLLAAAGYGPARPLRVRLAFTSGDVPRRVAVALAAMWKQVGVETTLEPGEAKATLAIVQRGEFEAFRYQWLSGTTDPASFMERFLADARAVNVAGYSNPAFDALYDRAERTRDLAARAESFRQAEALVLADMPVAPLYFYAGRRLVSQRVTGWTDSVRGIHLSRWLGVR